jgi:protein tyrosine phosphatase (PTP) superfamily phosphohydrolase (DUF442 family)
MSALAAAIVVAAVAGEAARPERWAAPVRLDGVPNLHKVSDSLYRSAQPTAEGMTNLVALGIKTVLNLRDNHCDSDEIGALPLRARRIEIFTGNMKEKYVAEFLAVLDDTNAAPVLVHCQHGADRTGTMCAMYRILRQGWSVDDAIDEMKNGGYGYHSFWINLPRFIRKAAPRRLEAEARKRRMPGEKVDDGEKYARGKAECAACDQKGVSSCVVGGGGERDVPHGGRARTLRGCGGEARGGTRAADAAGTAHLR